MTEQKSNPKAIFKTLSIIHIGLVGGLIAFMLFAYFGTDGFTAKMDNSDVFIYIVPIFAAAGYFGSQFMFKKSLSNIKQNDVLETKLGKYMTASIIKYAFIEGPAFLALVAFFTTQNALHFTIAICLIAYLITQRPSPSKLIDHIQLNREEKQRLDFKNI